MKSSLQLLLACLMTFGSVSHVAGEKASKTSAAVDSMSVDDAIQAACRGIGLTKHDRDAVKARKVQTSGESLPFLVDQLRGRTTWRIEFDHIRLADNSSDPRFQNRYITRLIVFLWPETGEVMKVVSAWPSGEPRIPTYPSCSDQERELKASAIIYTGAPVESPALTLLEALAKTQRMSQNVKQIYACSVMESRLKRDARPVWAIHLRGFPLSPVKGPSGAGDAQLSEHALNHMREVVDSETGEWIYASTTPQPTNWLEDRY